MPLRNALDAAIGIAIRYPVTQSRPRARVPDHAIDALAPAGVRLRADPATRLIGGGARLEGGAVLAGGSPVRVLRLTAGGARQVAGWLDGKPVPDGVPARKLARRLLDGGLAHPDFGDAGLITARSGVAGDRGAARPRVACGETRITARSGLVAGGARGPAVPGGALGPGDVTVVIPVRDRHGELATCLAGLRGTTGAFGIPGSSSGAGPGGTGGGHRHGDAGGAGRPGAADAGRMSGGASGRPRVIVVDDASADPAAIAAIAAAAGARAIRRPAGGGPGAARNTGLAAAATELVAFLDSDCVPGPGWLDALLPHFADPATGAVAPRIVPHEPGRTWLARYEGASSTLDMGTRPGIVRPGARVPYVPGAALVVRRAAAGDGFAAGLQVGEDVDFVWRLAAAGWRVRYEPAAVMGHQHRVRLRSWFARRADYGTSAAVLEQLHPGAVRPLRVSWWTAAAWAAVLARRPLTAAAITGTATALLARRLSRVTGEDWPGPGGVAWRLAARLAGGGTLAAGRPLGSALSRTWWPLAVPAAVALPRLRLPLAALVLAPPLLDWAGRRPPLDPVRYAAARLLDDIAYSAGVWQGCFRRCTVRPLLPVVGPRPPARGRRRVPRRAERRT